MAILPPSKLKNWEILESKDISPSKWIPIRQDLIKLAHKDKEVDFVLLATGPASMLFPFDKDKNLILVRQYKHGTGDLIVEGAAGMIDEGETPKQACVREAREELGAIVEESELIALGPHSQMPTKSTHVLHGFTAFDAELTEEQILDDQEEIEIIRLKPADAVKAIESGEIWASDTVAFILKIKLKYPELF
ncbi:MAG: NUDIX hydrolase [Candidatus Dojkabacteria bacterium]